MNSVIDIGRLRKGVPAVPATPCAQALHQLELIASGANPDTTFLNHLIRDLRIPPEAVTLSAKAIVEEVRYFSDIHRLSLGRGSRLKLPVPSTKEGDVWVGSQNFKNRQFARYLVSRKLMELQGLPASTAHFDAITLCVHQVEKFQGRTLQWLAQEKQGEPIIVLAGGSYPIRSPHFFRVTRHHGGRILFSLAGESNSVSPYPQDLTVSARHITLLGGYLDMCAARALRSSLKRAKLVGVKNAQVVIKENLSYLEGNPPCTLHETLAKLSSKQRESELVTLVNNIFGNVEEITHDGSRFHMTETDEYPNVTLTFQQ